MKPFQYSEAMVLAYVAGICATGEISRQTALIKFLRDHRDQALFYWDRPFRYDGTVDAEMIDWSDTNTAGFETYEIMVDGFQWGMWFYFPNAQDALAFKLRWC